MEDEPRRPMSSRDMIREAREDLETKKPDPALPDPVVDVPMRRIDEDKPWRDSEERAMPAGAYERRRRPAPQIPVQQPHERSQSASQAIALVSGILLALVGIGVALAIALANGG